MTIMVIWLPKMFLIVIADSFVPIYHWLEIEITGKIHKCTPIIVINDMNLKPPIFQIHRSFTEILINLPELYYEAAKVFIVQFNVSLIICQIAYSYYFVSY